MKSLTTIVVSLILLSGCADDPSPLIIHIANVHYVSRSDFVADLRAQDHTIPDAAINDSYAEFLDDVERLQNEQTAILRDLICQLGIRQIHVEGVTEANVDAFRAKARELAGIDFGPLHRQLTDENVHFAERAALLVEIDTLRIHRLQLGAVGQLLVAGEAIDVVPLDDVETFEAADPSNLAWRFDGSENEAREVTMAKRLLTGDPVTVCILGQAHDLRPELRELCPSCRLQVIRPEWLDQMHSTGN